MKTLRFLATGWALILSGVFIGPVLHVQAAAPIQYDKAVDATLAGNQQTEFTFTGKTGEKLTIAMNAIGGDIDPFIDLYDPQNRLIGEDDNSGGKDNALLRGIVLPADGNYRLLAMNKRGGSGKFSLIVSSSPIQGAATINFEGPQIKQNYQLSAPWDHKNVTYRIENTLPQFSPQAVKDVLVQAFQSWAAVTPLTFQEVSSGKVDIDIQFAHIDGPLNILGETCPPSSPCSGQMTLDDQENWTLGAPQGYNDISLLGVTSHELGHAIGLLHSSDAGALMYPTYNPNVLAPSADDVRGVQQLYGAGSGRVANQPGSGGAPDPNKPVVNGTLSDQQYVNFWDFDVQAGDVVTITMQSTSGGLDPFLVVLDANNHILAFDDDGGGGRNAQLRNIRFPSAGTYTVAATRYQQAQGYTSGGYTLTIQYGTTANAPQSTSLPTTVAVNPPSNNSATGGSGSVKASAGNTSGPGQLTTLDSTLAFPFDDSLAPETQTRNATVQRAQSYAWTRTWCAQDAATLNKTLPNIAVAFAVNGTAVASNLVARTAPHSASNGQSCVDYFVILSNWSAGQVNLTRTFTLKTAVFNGTNIYSPGDYVDQYAVTAQ